jgi:hypothetical protein
MQAVMRSGGGELEMWCLESKDIGRSHHTYILTEMSGKQLQARGWDMI